MSQRHPNVTHIDEVALNEGMTHGARFASRSRRIGAAVGAKKLGCSLYELAPGKRAFPRHAHLVNEESIFVLEGEGTLRIGDDEVAVRAGDYASFPPGVATAHQLINTSSGTLRYLCFSTMESPEIVQYPDSKKTGVVIPGSPPSRVLVKHEAQASSLAAYWEGEAGE